MSKFTAANRRVKWTLGQKATSVGITNINMTQAASLTSALGWLFDPSPETTDGELPVGRIGLNSFKLSATAGGTWTLGEGVALLPWTGGDAFSGTTTIASKGTETDVTPTTPTTFPRVDLVCVAASVVSGEAINTLILTPGATEASAGSIDTLEIVSVNALTITGTEGSTAEPTIPAGSVCLQKVTWNNATSVTVEHYTEPLELNKSLYSLAMEGAKTTWVGETSLYVHALGGSADPLTPLGPSDFGMPLEVTAWNAELQQYITTIPEDSAGAQYSVNPQVTADGMWPTGTEYRDFAIWYNTLDGSLDYRYETTATTERAFNTDFEAPTGNHFLLMQGTLTYANEVANVKATSPHLPLTHAENAGITAYRSGTGTLAYVDGSYRDFYLPFKMVRTDGTALSGEDIPVEITVRPITGPQGSGVQTADTTWPSNLYCPTNTAEAFADTISEGTHGQSAHADMYWTVKRAAAVANAYNVGSETYEPSAVAGTSSVGVSSYSSSEELIVVARFDHAVAQDVIMINVTIKPLLPHSRPLHLVLSPNTSGQAWDVSRTSDPSFDYFHDICFLRV